MSKIKLPFAVSFEIPESWKDFSADQLQVTIDAAKEHGRALFAKGKDSLTPEERLQGVELGRVFAAASGENDRRLQEAAAEAAAFSAAAEAFAAAPAIVEAVTVAEPALVGAGAPAATAADAAGAVASAFSAATAAPSVVEIPAARAGEAATTAPGPVMPSGDNGQVFGRFKYAAKSGLDEFTGLTQMAEQLVKQMGRYRGFSGEFSADPFMVYEREYPERYRGMAEGGPIHDGTEFSLMQAAAEEFKEVTNGNQTAAAAYCAPSLTLYELCELETSAGILPITEMQISRGGIFFTTGPDFASIYNGSGYWNYTEAQVIANTVKPCMEIPCPTFTEKRLVNIGLCITAGILQRRGYPELIARFIRGAMIAHLHRINAYVIAQIAAGSTLVDFDPPPAGSLVNDTTASGLLAALEMVAVDIRARNRMDPKANIEAVAPYFVIPQLRADVSRRTGVDMISVGDNEIMSWFSDRNITLRLVYDYQDAFSGVPTGPGAAAPGMTSFPATVEVLMYPPGTWVKGVDDTIKLETVYDSVKLSTNQYTALFMEEGVLVAQTCPDSRRVVYPLCPTGATTELVTRACA